MRVVGLYDDARTLAAAVLRAMAVPDKLQQILLNVLPNAIKLTERGGAIELRAAGDAAGRATIALQDTGVGTGWTRHSSRSCR